MTYSVERAFPELFSIILAAALLAAFAPEGPLLRWIPIVAALGALVDFAVRAVHEWKRLVDA